MVKWIQGIHWGKVIGIGVLFAVISMVVRQLEMLWTIQYYTDPAYFGLWSPLMMPKAGPPPPEFFIFSIISSIFTGMALTLIYYYLREYLPKGYWKRSFFFADVLVATSFIFFTVPVALLFHIPYGLLAWWFGSTFVIVSASSLVIVKMVGMK